MSSGPQNQQVQLEDPGAIAQRLYGNKGAGGEGGGKSIFDNFESFALKTLNFILPAKWLPKGLGAVSIFQQVESKGWAASEINKGAKALNARGGLLAQTVGDGGLQFTYKNITDDIKSKVSALDVPRLEVKDAPVDTNVSSGYASSGSLRGGGGMDSVG